MTNTQRNPMTRAGYDRFYAEFDHLSRVERPRVVRGITEAAAEGDRSENAEYIYGKKHLREIDKRLAYLSKMLKYAQVMDEKAMSGDAVCFGATVVVRDEDEQIKRWRIVGDGEADTREGTISWKSPVGRALLGKRVSAIVEIERPKGPTSLEVVGILFGDRLIAGTNVEQ